jgi:SET domain-containing protein
MGRLVNHGRNPNVRGYVALVESNVRPAFLAIRIIKAGDEVTVDYGRQPNPPPWMRKSKLFLFYSLTPHRPPKMVENPNFHLL